MSVITPSTWGMMTAESRDFNVATYSVLSLTGTSRAISTFTGIACGPWPAPAGSFFPLHATHKHRRVTAIRTDASRPFPGETFLVPNSETRSRIPSTLSRERKPGGGHGSQGIMTKAFLAALRRFTACPVPPGTSAWLSRSAEHRHSWRLPIPFPGRPRSAASQPG
jgi:hypothetical protein